MYKSLDGILNTPIRSLKGIGDVRLQAFGRLDIYTIADLLTHFPRDYEDRRNIKKIADLQDGEECTFIGKIASPVTETSPRRNMTIQKTTLEDNSGRIQVVWFNRPFIKKALRQGYIFAFYGKIDFSYNQKKVVNPVYERIEGNKDTIMAIMPIYQSNSGLSQSIIRSCVKDALQRSQDIIIDHFTENFRKKYRLEEINYCIRSIHFPASDKDLQKARYRLVFEELVLFQAGFAMLKDTIKNNRQGISFKKTKKLKDFIEKLPFKLTNAQNKVLDEIWADMEMERPMNRLLQGDVGSGKTVVALAAMMNSVYNGFQSVLMVPSTILACQHYENILGLVHNEEVRVVLLTGGISGSEKKIILEEIRNGKANIIIGTHALLEKGVDFRSLGMVVTDEQHRFGVRQRELLANKSQNPDLLVMTATPIPRTLALILYGDLDISIIDRLPPGRIPVETYAVDESKRKRINEFIRKIVKEGRQVFTVCPVIDESEAIDAVSAEQYAEQLKNETFRDLKVGLVHGKLKKEINEKTMSAFSRGEIDILVTTTVIEVGIDVPNAALMVVENAERFGLAQLHQLRGRVGRGGHKSFCILFNQSSSRLAAQRMKAMEQSTNGFVISEKDLELRGPGDFFGTRQHGIPELKIANLYSDADILIKAREAVDYIIEGSREGNEELLKIKKSIKKLFDEKMQLSIVI